MRLVHIAAFARTEAVMMQTDRTLTEALAGIFGCRRMDAEPGAAADTVEGVGRVGDDLQAQNGSSRP